MADQAPPSELSLNIFAAYVAADEAIPVALRAAVAENKSKGASELLAEIKRAVGEASEA